MTSTQPTSFPGPAPLGRGVVLLPGQTAPAVFDGVPRYVIDERALRHPGPLAQRLHHHWVRREPTVVTLAVDNAALQAPETTDLPPWQLGPWFGFERERLAHRLWANSYDLRGGEPVWWRGVLAARHTDLTPAPPDVAGDVLLPDGTPAWVDGGPRGPVPGVDQALVHRESVELLHPRRTTVLGEGPVPDDLDPSQHAAADHDAGPARVLAPAGSGKTRVLTARLRHLLGARGVEPGLVTAVAYNKRAQVELSERVAAAGHSGANVRTVHALAYAICRDAGHVRVLDERDVRSILDELVSVARVPNTDPFQAWLEALSQVRLELRSPTEVEAARDDVPGFVEVFDRFRAELARREAVDFDEQVTRAIELLCRDPELRATWRARCTHLLVDELQDVTPAFVLLLRLLAWPDLQVFGVGDDDQVIYGHAGADPAFLLDYDLLFPGAADLRLATNYRCPPDVVEAAATLLGHNRHRAAKRITAAPDRGDRGLRVEAVAATATAGTVTAHVGELLEGGTAPADVAVLARVNAALLPFQVALHQAGVPTTAPLDATVLRRTGVRTALAYLRIAVDADRVRRDDLYETVNRPSRQLRSALTPYLRQRATWTLDALADIGVALSDAQADRLADYVLDLRALATAARDGATTAQLLLAVRDDVGLGEAMSLLDGGSRNASGSSHGDDLAALLQLATHQPDPALFAGWLRDALSVPGDPAGVTLSSVHRVKGLEWDHVVVAPVSDGLVPHRLAEDVEEERRVLHVAVTRGRRDVLVVVDRDRPGPFAAQLRTAAADPGGDPHADLAALGDAPAPPAPATTDERDGAVVAVPGLRVGLPGGAAAVLDEVDATQRVAVGRFLVDGRPGDARLRLPLRGAPGADGDAPPPVEVGGAWTVLCAPAPPRRALTTGTGPGADGRRQPSLIGGGASAVEERLAAAPAEVGDLYEALRSWRTEQAREQKVPPYVVFDNKTLLQIAERRPTDARALLAVPGIGATKLDRYGDDVLAVVLAAT